MWLLVAANFNQPKLFQRHLLIKKKWWKLIMFSYTTTGWILRAPWRSLKPIAQKDKLMFRGKHWESHNESVGEVHLQWLLQTSTGFWESCISRVQGCNSTGSDSRTQKALLPMHEHPRHTSGLTPHLHVSQSQVQKAIMFASTLPQRVLITQ